MLAVRVVLVVCGLGAVSPAFAQPRMSPAKPTADAAIIALVPATHRDKVAAVVNKPTLSAKYTEEPFLAHATVYEWLLEHPDRVSLGWQRMSVPCVEITEPTPGTFTYTDEQGSVLSWQVVSKSAAGLVWYASGKVKPAALLPMVPIKAVVVVKYTPRPTGTDGEVRIAPEASVFLHSDSRAANAILRLVGPAAPKLAEQGAEQLLFFFSGVATYLHQHPEKIPTLLAAKK